MLDDGKVIKCPICGKPYRIYSYYAHDQSVCPKCRIEADKNMGLNKWDKWEK